MIGMSNVLFSLAKIRLGRDFEFQLTNCILYSVDWLVDIHLCVNYDTVHPLPLRFLLWYTSPLVKSKFICGDL